METIRHNAGTLVGVRALRIGLLAVAAIVWRTDVQTVQEIPDALALADALRVATSASGHTQLIPAVHATLRMSCAVIEGVHDVVIEWSDSCGDLVDVSPEQALMLADYIARNGGAESLVARRKRNQDSPLSRTRQFPQSA